MDDSTKAAFESIKDLLLGLRDKVDGLAETQGRLLQAIASYLPEESEEAEEDELEDVFAHSPLPEQTRGSFVPMRTSRQGVKAAREEARDGDEWERVRELAAEDVWREEYLLAPRTEEREAEERLLVFLGYGYRLADGMRDNPDGVFEVYLPDHEDLRTRFDATILTRLRDKGLAEFAESEQGIGSWRLTETGGRVARLANRDNLKVRGVAIADAIQAAREAADRVLRSWEYNP